MMFSIISEVNIRKVFNRVIQAGLDIIFSEGEVREVSGGVMIGGFKEGFCWGYKVGLLVRELHAGYSHSVS